MKKLLIKKSVIYIITTICGISIPHTSYSEQPFEKAIYLEKNFGMAWIDTEEMGYSKETTTGFSFNLNSGYRFHRYLSAEIGFIHYPDWELVGESQYYLDTRKITGKTNAFYLAPRLIYPIDKLGMEVYSKAGLAITNSYVDVYDDLAGKSLEDATEYGAALMIGAGFSMDIIKYVAVGVQWHTILNAQTALDIEATQLHTLTAGIQLKYLL